MSRKPTQATDEATEHLKQFVIKKAGLPCNSFHDIQQLHRKIKTNTNEHLGVQTLNRFFRLIKTDFRSSSATLNILSRFVGYHSFEEFEILCHHPLSHSNNKVVSAFLATLFSDVEFQTMQESGLLNVTRNVCKIVETTPSIADEIYSLMASSKYGRRYFFEHFVNIDALNGHYGDGLNYYILHAKHPSQLFFANTLLCKRYLLAREYELFDQFYQKTLAFPFAEIKNFDPYLIASYYAVKSFKSIIHSDKLWVADEALHEFSKLPRGEVVNSSFPSAEYILADALVLAEEYYQAWKVLEAGMTHLKYIPPSVDNSFETQYELLKLYAGYFAGVIPEKKAIVQLKAISAKPFFFLSKKYFSFFLLILNKALLPKTETKSFSLQIKNLIEKTGFRHFEKVVEKLAS